MQAYINVAFFALAIGSFWWNTQEKPIAPVVPTTTPVVTVPEPVPEVPAVAPPPVEPDPPAVEEPVVAPLPPQAIAAATPMGRFFVQQSKPRGRWFFGRLRRR
jgi:hypothetical protein